MNEILTTISSQEECIQTEEELLLKTVNQEVENIEGVTEMPDISETPPVEEDLSEEKEAEEAPAPVNDEEEILAEIPEKLTKAEIVARIKALVDQDVAVVKDEIDSLRQTFYQIKQSEAEEAGEASGEDEEADIQTKDEWDDELKSLLHRFKERKAKVQAEEEKQKAINLAEKKSILEALKKLTESEEDFYGRYNEFRHLQQRWKEIKLVPQAEAGKLWKEYQHCCEIFYELVRLNNEMRVYDYKKNLEQKTALCEIVERLKDEPNVVSAYHCMQKFQREWREIGPVAREYRQEILTRFKLASAEVEKMYRLFLEKVRRDELANLETKNAICKKIEEINYDELTTVKDWDEKNKYVLELQQEWKATGFAPKKRLDETFKRFRAACDVFFQKKGAFYKHLKASREENLEKKKALCEKAEALKDSTNWKETTEKLTALKKEWKTIGSVERKDSDVVWKRFISACDYFFEQKDSLFAARKGEEKENLRLKNGLIDQIDAIDGNPDKEEAMKTFRRLAAEWDATGYVPFDAKETVNKRHREAVAGFFARLKIDPAERKLESFKSTLNNTAGGDRSKNRLLEERDKLMNRYENLKSDLQTCENNIGFFSVASKGGNSLMKEMNRNIDALKAELELVVKKIQAIDETLDTVPDERG
jgi:hypothetical protein